jgi:hypothetical protein
MNENQKNFLNELAALLDKYSIDNVNTASDEKIHFHSNGQVLRFFRYVGGVFYGIETNLKEYTPSGQ